MTSPIIHLENISQLNKMLGHETHNPLITILDFAKVKAPLHECTITTNFYAVLAKDACHAELKYGRNRYDYQEETMIFLAPRQVIGIESVPANTESKGLGLFFHPDLLRGTSLAAAMKNYNFFSYEVNEALHLSSEERATIGDCIEKISKEIIRPIDKHSKRIIVSNIELLLGYCERFYDRQFITREILNHDTITKFESVLEQYFNDKMPSQQGLPTVKYFADKLHLSPNYMSDVIKRETGRSAQEHIQILIMERAKTALSLSSASVAEIAYSLGFEYPQYFSRQFKKRVGKTPNEYRAELHSMN